MDSLSVSVSAHVTFRIYSATGTEVRTLALGHQSAGWYQTRKRAAYWEGKNNFGESVVSGVYFYTLTIRSDTGTGDFSATRNMVILKSFCIGDSGAGLLATMRR